VWASGVAQGAIISGGTQEIWGSASGTTVSSGGFDIIISGGSDSGAIVSSGGTHQVWASGLGIGTHVNSGGVEQDWGTASGAAVSSGGTQYVYSGGAAVATTVNGGGYEQVFSGGTANATTINGGTLEVGTGGSAGAVLFASGGTLQLDSLVAFGGTISGFHLGDEIDLRSLAFTSGVTTATWSQTTSGSGTLTVGSGATVENLTLLGQYSLANFSVTSDGQGGTLITDPPVSNSVVQISLVAQH
jgi:autotransporter passenger strand-loop-strand repeat protein